MTSPAIELSQLAVHAGGRCLLEVNHLRAEAGAVTAIIGPNGAGKTTLLRACLGLAAVEGMASGKPVVITAMGGGPEVVTQDTGILVKANDADPLVRAILSLADDRQLRLRLGAAGAVRARAVFDENIGYQTMEKMFLGLIKN